MLSDTAKSLSVFTVFILILFSITFFYYSSDLKQTELESREDFEIPIYTQRRSIINNNNRYFHNVFDMVGFEGYLEHFFPSELFDEPFDKTNWIDGVNAIFTAYKNHFTKVELFFDTTAKEFDVIFYLKKNNKKYFFAGGRMLSNEKKSDIKHYIPYYYAYPTDSGILLTKYPYVYTNVIFNMHRDYDFYADLYGLTRRQINSNLKWVEFGRFSFPINGGTECYAQAQKVFDIFKKKREEDDSLRRWFNSIKSISSFSYRRIASTDRPSMHTFAIAMDILTRDARPNYWYWSSKLKLKWWNIPPEERAFVPQEVVKVFEDNGFCWGGKWERFDVMHFEYKPENLYKKIR